MNLSELVSHNLERLLSAHELRTKRTRSDVARLAFPTSKDAPRMLRKIKESGWADRSSFESILTVLDVEPFELLRAIPAELVEEPG